MALLSEAFSLGFGSMGNTSAGLGDSGVALRKSAWGIYYNPALLASDNRGKFAYSFGGGFSRDAIPQKLNNSRFALNLNTQNGIVAQVTGGTHEIPELDSKGEPTETMVEVRNDNGALAIAGFASLHVDGMVQSSSTHHISGELNGIALIEVPIGWGWRFQTHHGDLSVGIALKYMGATGLKIQASQNGNNQVIDSDLENIALRSDFGIDLGILYSPTSNLHLGFVAKNINTPSFDLTAGRLDIAPQFRLGLSYEMTESLIFTFDADILPNLESFKNSPKTQNIGGGILFDVGYIDLRVGIMKDIADKEQGPILTAGINLLGFLDLAVQSGLQTTKVRSFKIPTTLAVKLGGSFTF